MFNQLFQRHKARKLHLTAPLLEERLRYFAYLSAQGFKPPKIRDIASFQLRLIKYLRLERNKMLTYEEITSAANRWALYSIRRYRSRNACYSSCKETFTRRALQWLKFLNRVEIPLQTPIPAEINEFIDYMRNEKGLSENTIKSYRIILKIFFSKIKEDLGQFFVRLSPGYLDKIIIREFHEGVYSRKSIKQYTCVFRAFLRYAEHRGLCRTGIADSIKNYRSYAHQTIPSSPPWDDVQRLLKTSEGNDPKNIRDRAILLLLTVYGLRANEVRQLRFDDIDWEKEIIHIKHSKHGPTQQFPLIQSVGQALIRYIKEVRPTCPSHSEIFLTRKAPYRPLKNFYNVVADRWEPLNVAIKRHGPHSLRHACATRLINQGMSLKTIADQLGHRSLDSTGIYAKVDLTRLREVANFKIGGML
jgi:integrase/recombinase XerD